MDAAKGGDGMRLLTIVLLSATLQAAPVISHYSAEIRRESTGQFIVKVSVQVAGGEWAKPAFTLGPFQAGGFQGCDGCTAQPRGILQRLSGGLEFSYRIAAAPAGEREFIPLAVPEISGPAAPDSVVLSLFPGDGMVPDGDMFPVLTATGDGRWSATMANVVNHVEFHKTGALGPRQWSDIAVIIMIIGGLLVRAGLARKAKSA